MSRIQEYLNKEKPNAKKMAEVLGLSVSTVRAMASGQVKRELTLSEAKKVAEAFDVDPFWLSDTNPQGAPRVESVKLYKVLRPSTEKLKIRISLDFMRKPGRTLDKCTKMR